jgi:putative oxidoreductase
MTLLQRLADTKAPPAVILIRVVVGGIFVSEGIQKFLFSDLLGAGRFEKIGIPAPAFFGPFVGACELVCGALLLAGLLTRLASFVLLMCMSVAIVSTKLPVLLGRPIWGFSLPKLQQYGFWSALHEARADLFMIFGLLFLLIVGAGPWSGDGRLFRE